MALFNNSQVRRYRYKVAQCVLIIENEAIEVKPEAVGGLMIEERFSTAVYPIFRLNVATDSDTYYKISKYKTSLKVHLTIQKYYVVCDSNGKPTKKSAKKIWIDDDFCTITKDININKQKDIDMLEDKKKVNSGDSEDRNSVSELYLWRVEIANGFKKVLNAVICGSTMSSIIAWALGNAGITNCIMSPLENNRRYGEVLIPPLPINRLLQHLDAMYGFYKNGTMIYFGLKQSYILNINAKCTAWGRNEVQSVTILIPKVSVTESSGDGGNVDRGESTNCHYIYMKYMDSDFSSPSTVDNVTKGVDAVVMNQSSASASSAKGKGRNINNQNNTKVFSDFTENPWMANIYAVRQSLGTSVLSGMLNNIDLDDLTPNKLYTVAVEDPEECPIVKGNYKLFSAVHRFVNDSATGDFSVESVVEFKRIEL